MVLAGNDTGMLNKALTHMKADEISDAMMYFDNMGDMLAALKNSGKKNPAKFLEDLGKGKTDFSSKWNKLSSTWHNPSANPITIAGKTDDPIRVIPENVHPETGASSGQTADEVGDVIPEKKVEADIPSTKNFPEKKEINLNKVETEHSEGSIKRSDSEQVSPKKNLDEVNAPNDKQIAAGEKPLKSEVPVAKTSRQKKFDDDINKSLQEGKITQQEADVMKQYNDAVPNGKLSVDDIKKKLDNGEEFNPQTKRFGNSSKGINKRRDELMGPTPRKNSEIGKKVKEKMFKEGYFDYGPPETFKSVEDGEWYNIEYADMSHKPKDFEHFLPHPDAKNRGAAVEYWNSEGKKYGPKSKEVREFMKNPDNYYLEFRSYNRRDGAKLGMKYDNPL